ncbi:MAG: chaperone NapD [Thermodesulfobacteriota bacterium]|nr:chaperone NapD [Thermodesulfobacteriota bacterium]
MIVSSGFLIIDVAFQEQILKELEGRGIELHGVKNEKVVFLAEGENATELKSRMDSLQGIDGVQSVYLTYFSLEDPKEDNQAGR